MHFIDKSLSVKVSGKKQHASTESLVYTQIQPSQGKCQTLNLIAGSTDTQPWAMTQNR